jgi:hypothetical protein
MERQLPIQRGGLKCDEGKGIYSVVSFSLIVLKVLLSVE